MDLSDTISRIRAFNASRNWDAFHNPKNLAMAICGEAGELAAELQWLGSDEIARRLREDADFHASVSSEAADVLIYLLTFAHAAEVDLKTAVNEKLDRNESRFPPTSQ